MQKEVVRPRGQVKRNFTFLVSYANSIDELDNAYGCDDYKSFAEAEKFVRDTFFNNPHMQNKGIYVISTYDPKRDIVIDDICKCYWENNQLCEMI